MPSKNPKQKPLSKTPNPLHYMTGSRFGITGTFLDIVQDTIDKFRGVWRAVRFSDLNRLVDSRLLDQYRRYRESHKLHIAE